MTPVKFLIIKVLCSLHGLLVNQVATLVEVANCSTNSMSLSLQGCGVAMVMSVERMRPLQSIGEQSEQTV